MSIILKGIDMPKEGEYIPMRIYGNGHIWVNGAYKGVAIQIPTPHGRLIDGDELKEKRETMCWKDEYYMAHESEFVDTRHIDNAPTILEAEE